MFVGTPVSSSSFFFFSFHTVGFADFETLLWISILNWRSWRSTCKRSCKRGSTTPSGEQVWRGNNFKNLKFNASFFTYQKGLPVARPIKMKNKKSAQTKKHSVAQLEQEPIKPDVQSNPVTDTWTEENSWWLFKRFNNLRNHFI